MKIFAVTQKGTYKTENEDRLIVGKNIIAEGRLSAELEKGVLAAADGVGGRNAGSFASHYLAKSVCDMEEMTPEGLKAVNDGLLALSEADKSRHGMASTLSGLFFDGKEITLFSIGNTRVYVLQSGKYLKQLTTDDTTLNYLLSTGQLSYEDADKYERKNEITACFGGGTNELFKPKISKLDTAVSAVMITSDGIHDYLSVDMMESIIERFGFTEKTCDEMIATARANGSCDDASIILGQ